MCRLLLYLILLAPFVGNGQANDNTLAYKSILQNRYFRLNYENDYFSARDRFYTQGVSFELASPALRHNPISRLLPGLKQGDRTYGLTLEHDAYTPTSIQASEILYGDRPYCASFFLKSFSIANDANKNRRLSAALSLGVVGAAAGGEQVQTNIHQWTGNIIPLGWKHQIRTDVVANYQVNYEQQILHIKNNVLLTTDVMGRVGSLSTKASVGTTAMVGHFASPFGGDAKKWSVYVYDRPAVSAIGYDASLQGGLFNKSSTYVIDSKDIMRGVFENRFGIVVAYKRIYLEYFQSFMTREFRTQADEHRWGGIQIALGF